MQVSITFSDGTGVTASHYTGQPSVSPSGSPQLKSHWPSAELVKHRPDVHTHWGDLVNMAYSSPVGRWVEAVSENLLFEQALR